METAPTLFADARAYEPDFRAVFDATPGLYLVVLPNDPVYTIVAANKAYEAAVLIKREEMIGRPLFEVFPDNDPSATGMLNVRASLRGVLGTKAADRMAMQRYDIPRPQSKGSGFEERYWRALNWPVLGAGGEVTYIIHHVEDVTEQQRAEKALHLSEARHAFLLTLSDALRPLRDPEAIKAAACRVLGERLRANRAFYAEVQGDDWVVEGGYAQDVAPLPPGRYGASTYGRRIMETFRAGKRMVFHDALSEPGFTPEEREALVGIKVLASAGVPLVKEGKLVAILTVQSAEPRDWTEDGIALVEETAERTWAAVEHAHAEAALRQSEERMRLALEIDTIGVIFFDLDGNIHRSNEAFQRMSGYGREEFPLRWDKLTPPEWLENSLAIARQLATTGRATPYEKEYVRPDGSRWWGLFAPRMLNECEAVEFILDISASKRAEEELQQRNEELARSNRALEEFAYVASHDLQEPLRMVNGYSQLLIRRLGAEATDEQQEFAGLLQHGVKKMEQLIKDLLVYSRAVHTTGELATSLVNLEEALNQALFRVDARVAETKATITHHALPTVRGDVTQLSQVFQNLLSNALKYRNPNEPPRIHIGVEQRHGYWVVSAKDNGIGFEQHQGDRIFGLFKRLHREEEYPGTGVGLAICKRIVERLGGKMWAEGEPGVGSTFYFSLPVLVR